MDDTIYHKELVKLKDKQSDIKRLFRKLKSKKRKNVDDLFHSLHDEVFEKIDCLSCANCCKTTSPIFRDVDIVRISKKLKMSVSQFENQYLNRDEDGDKVLKSSPCAFLGSDNKCFIYDFRPQACREYPHTDRKNMSSILNLTRKNTEVCPAVAMIVDRILKKKEEL